MFYTRGSVCERTLRAECESRESALHFSFGRALLCYQPSVSALWSDAASIDENTAAANMDSTSQWNLKVIAESELSDAVLAFICSFLFACCVYIYLLVWGESGKLLSQKINEQVLLFCQISFLISFRICQKKFNMKVNHLFVNINIARISLRRRKTFWVALLRI